MDHLRTSGITPCLCRLSMSWSVLDPGAAYIRPGLCGEVEHSVPELESYHGFLTADVACK
jgi:hypothetical protein